MKFKLLDLVKKCMEFIKQSEVLFPPSSQPKSHDKLHDDSHSLPSKLLLTEFRSLVVSHPRPNAQITAKNNYGELKNYKKFRKVSVYFKLYHKVALLEICLQMLS